jgi:5-methylcytosine-specific restriction endonuclease McrA
MATPRKSIKRSVFMRLFLRQAGLCHLCKKAFEEDSTIHTHHLLSVSSGGSDDLENLALLHKDCHAVAHGAENIEIAQVVINTLRGNETNSETIKPQSLADIDYLMLGGLGIRIGD